MTVTREHLVPRKLEKGMHVVVWIKPEYYLFDSEMKAGLVQNTWLEGIITSERITGLVFVEINGIQVSNIVPGLIIIRSTAYKHNDKPRVDSNNQARDKTKLKEIRNNISAERKAKKIIKLCLQA